LARLVQPLNRIVLLLLVTCRPSKLPAPKTKVALPVLVSMSSSTVLGSGAAATWPSVAPLPPLRVTGARGAAAVRVEVELEAIATDGVAAPLAGAEPAGPKEGPLKRLFF